MEPASGAASEIGSDAFDTSRCEMDIGCLPAHRMQETSLVALTGEGGEVDLGRLQPLDQHALDGRHERHALHALGLRKLRELAHMPVADEEVEVLLIEPKTTLNTGNLKNERTVEVLRQI